MGANQSLQHLRGREVPSASLSRIKGTQTETKASQTHTTLISYVTQQVQESVIKYTSRLMNDNIGNAYNFDFVFLRRENAGRVCRVTCRRSGRKAEVLLKRKHLEDPSQLESIKKEVEIWLSLDHPHIARHVISVLNCAEEGSYTRTVLLDVFEDESGVYLVSEFCPGGSLYDYLASLQKCPEEVSRQLVLQMVKAIGFLQGRGIVHRDLRLESWQLTNSGDLSCLKLYGLSHCTRWRNKEGRLNAACGILIYTSPDVLLGRYTEACDMWSLGVIAYQLLCGRPPFQGSRQDIIRQILSGAVNMQHLEKAGVSEEASSFVMQLLTISPHTRLTPQQALEHPWLFGQMHAYQCLPPACVAGLRWFANSGALRRASLLMCAYCLNSDQCESVGKLFAAASHSSSGCLTLEDLRRTLQRAQLEPLVDEEVEEIFEALDISKDSEITFSVFAAAQIGSLIEPEESLLKAAFAKLDADRDGRLSLDDCRRALGDPLFSQSIASALSQEEDEDGHLSYSSFAALIREKDKPPPHRDFRSRLNFESGRDVRSPVSGRSPQDLPISKRASVHTSADLQSAGAFCSKLHHNSFPQPTSVGASFLHTQIAAQSDEGNQRHSGLLRTEGPRLTTAPARVASGPPAV
ncbi:CAM CDPK domain-containing protein [Cyclospora cayetanensis]|uniref:CAM CDPK domain-containing protein n=1 Tax=Cyclospora cayetanensis TaxID=88456 RepID=A0A1D3DB52_9EIME|nr:CAM CDPK domain-containing protein [Cyclospora cayetanensis]